MAIDQEDLVPTDTLSSLSALLAGDPLEENTPQEDIPEDELDDTNPEVEDETTEDEPEVEDETTDEEDNLLTDEYFEDTYVQVNGDKIKLGELTKGYMRQADYSRKTQEVAAQRKEAETLASTAEAKAQELIQQRFNLVALDVEKRIKQFENVNWKTLAQTSPNDYTALRAEYDELIHDANKLQNEFHSLQETQRQKYERQLQETAKETFKTLSEEIPKWGKELYMDMLSYAVDSGMNPDVASNIVDAGSLRLLYKAYMYDKGKKELTENVKTKVKQSVKSKLKTKAKPSPVSVNETSVTKISDKLKYSKTKNERNQLEVEYVKKLLGS